MQVPEQPDALLHLGPELVSNIVFGCAPLQVLGEHAQCTLLPAPVAHQVAALYAMQQPALALTARRCPMCHPTQEPVQVVHRWCPGVHTPVQDVLHVSLLDGKLLSILLCAGEPGNDAFAQGFML